LRSLIEGKEGLSLATAIKLSFPDSNPNSKLEPFKRLETVISFFKGNDPSNWHTNVPVWGGVRYKGLYPGVDLVLEGEGGRIKMRWDAQPGAELERLRLRVEGAREVSIEGGNLVLVTDVGEFSLRLPVLEGVNGRLEVEEIPGEDGAVSYEVSSPWTEKGEAPPTSAADEPSDLLYATFLGGVENPELWEGGYAVVVGADGSAYVTGYTEAIDFPTTLGAFDTSHNGWRDAFVVKLNPNGSSLSYGTFIGGSSYDYGYGIAVDGGGNAYVTGETYSSDFPTTTGAFDTSHNGDRDAFVVKLDPNGSSLFYGTFIGGSDKDWGWGIAIDGGGNAYVTGETDSSDFPTTPGAFDTSRNGDADAFVVKLNPNGSSLSYGTFIGGSSRDYGEGIAVDGGGNAYVTGLTGSSDFPTTSGAFDTSYNGGWSDAFVVKLNPNGSSLFYGTFIGGSSWACGEGIAVDGGGNAYVTGFTYSSDFPTTPGAFDTSLDGYDAFVVKLNPNGSSLSYGTFIGGSSYDYGWGIAVDGGGNAYVTGEAESSDFPTTTGAFDTSHNGGYDAFVVKLDPNGSSLVYGTFIGGSDDEWGFGIAVDGGGNAYVTGLTESSDFPTTSGAFDRSINGHRDAFVVKLSQSGSSLSYGTFLGGEIGSPDYGHAIAVDDEGYAYVTGYTEFSDFPTTPGAFDTSYNWGGDAFVVKLDPDGSSLSYGTFIGGSDDEYGWGIAVDGGGNAYVTGKTRSSDFPTTSGAFDPSLSGYYDTFVVKLDPNGSSILYGTFIGGSSLDWDFGIAVDGGGNAYVTGVTWSSNFPTTPGAFDTTCGTDGNCNYDGTYKYADAFVVKLNPNGSSLVYGTFIGGSDDEWGFGIAVDGGGNAYVTGEAESSDFPTTSGAFDTSHNGGYDAFVVKLNPTGSSLSYGTFIGGSDDEWGLGIAVDGGGNAYVTGSTDSSDFPTTSGAFDTSLSSYYDAFVVKLDPSGSSLIYGTFIGGSYDDLGRGIAVDGGGNAYVTGLTRSSDFPTTSGAFDTSHNGDRDAFVVKLDPNGSSLFYGTFIGGSSGDRGRGIAVDGGGNAYVTGLTYSSDFPITPGAFDTTCDDCPAYPDAFVVKLWVGEVVYLPIVFKNH
jgi:hypothetical protein